MDKAKSALESQVIMLKRAWEFISKVKSRLSIIDVYVVGSRARGDYTGVSDIDLVIISNDVKGLNQLERRLLLKDLLEPRVKFFIYTKDEWDEEASVWVSELKREAVRLIDLLKEYNVTD
jgi:predicted nucleotidyltransferase